MTIEFLSENENYQPDSFPMLLKTIQTNFGMFTAVLNTYFADFRDTIPDINQFIDTTSIYTLSHSFARCYATRAMLNAFFDISKWYDYPDFKPDDMKFRIIQLSGNMFPDHTFVIIEFREEFFLLQSYYYAYLLSGKYGILQLDASSMRELDEILFTYKDLVDLGSITPGSDDHDNLLDANKRLSKFTGIDPEKSIGNISVRDRGDNNIEDIFTYANSQCVFRALDKRMTLFGDTLLSKIGSLADVIRLPFHYFFSDAFIPEVWNDDEEGNIRSLNPVLRKEIFKNLVGTEYPVGNVMGIDVGHTIHIVKRPGLEDKEIYGFISTKTIEIPIQSIFEMFVDIKTRINPLVENSRSMNLWLAKEFPDNIIIGDVEIDLKMSDVIVMDETRQVTKKVYAPILMDKYGYRMMRL